MDLEDIKQFIPQREPIIMVDRLVRVAAEEAVTSLVVRDTLCFVNETWCLSEPGLIEHIAQSASAFAGYAARAAGATKPPVGYIGEVKKFHCYRLPECGEELFKFHCYRLPECGEELFTTIAWGPEVGGVRIVSGETRAADEVVAETQMKIFTR